VNCDSQSPISFIDGVAGLSKQSQQRKRRFKSAFDKREKESYEDDWDSINLTAGTEYMKDLCEYIRQSFTNNPIDVTVMIDDMFNFGEGEHKLIQYIVYFVL
jgi:5'-3' exonuclease